MEEFKRAKMCQPNAEPLKYPTLKPSSAHTDHFIRLWMKRVGRFEVVVAGNEGGAFLLPSPFVRSWVMSLLSAWNQLVESSPPSGWGTLFPVAYKISSLLYPKIL